MSETADDVLQQLLISVNTIHISSITKAGQPNISYAPYVRDADGNYYIFISQLASHTHDLLHTPAVAIMLSEDEQNTRQIFARTRVTYQCEVETVAQDAEEYAEILGQFANEFGNVIDVLRGLPDFILFRLVPRSGRFVMGFGQAYELQGKGLSVLKHIDSGR